MKIFAAVLATFTVCSQVAMIHAQELTEAASVCAAASIGGSTEVGSLRYIRDGQIVEFLHGYMAINHLSKKRSRHPERFVGFGGSLAARGYRPTGMVVVLRSVGPARFDPAGESGGTTAFAAFTDSNSEGEQIFWSWDDGDDATWEGTQYVERYSDGSWVTYDGQLDISNNDGHVIWGEETGRGGGTVYDQISHSHSSHRLAISPQRLSTLLVHDVLHQSPIQEWAICLVAGCAGCAGGCVFTGPVYPQCFGNCCFGVSIACALEYYLGGESGGGGGGGSGGGGGGGWLNVGPDGSA